MKNPSLFASISLASVAFLLGCSSGNCRSQNKDKEERNLLTQNALSKIENENPTEKVRVYKLDGSLQCDQGQPKNLEAMGKELGGIKIYKSMNKNDGIMRIQKCGSPTGMCNIYEIDAKDLVQAQKAGFKQWTGNF